MAQVKGLTVYCDRCPTSIFLKFEGMKPQEWSQPKEVYESLPKGWATTHCLGKYVDLCPDCASKFVKIQTEFMAPPQPPARRIMQDIDDKTESGLFAED